MRAAVITYLPWLLSALTIWSAWLAGQKRPAAWGVGLANQGLWLVWIAASEAWGLVPMNIALWIVFYRNLMLWRVAA